MKQELEKQKERKKFLKMFGESTKGNFKIIDTIGTPHPYCIAPCHLEFNDSMYLGSDQIRQMEKDHPDKVMCDICKRAYRKNQIDKILSYDEHKQSLVVECLKPMGKKTEKNLKLNPELKKFLLSIKAKAEKKKFDGFAFVDKNRSGAKVE